ncbi:hypothetical protein NEF87_002489 [Candidatus Lokiarchaeum ossiferum]|uniref:GLMA-like second domain-containing protein n=1 Tax=Candidatus Lokiarchaeum ossiferum TaxID=2951803 RepID=A0ABY6HUI5_9ARCH|nr:hypothetical protein NEF87_002489 [Candidatus Lokiarchaeum sp. B-35]
MNLLMENFWDFAKYIELKYRYDTTPMYRSLLSIANGLNSPFFEGKKLNPQQLITNSFDSPTTQKGISAFFDSPQKKEFRECSQESLISIGYYEPYTKSALDEGQKPIFGHKMIIQFHLAIRHIKLGYNIINLEDESLIEKMPKLLLFVSSTILSKAVQLNLIEYVRKGGHLCIFGDFPVCDEQHQTYSLIKDEYSKTQNSGKIKYFKGNPLTCRRGIRYYLEEFSLKYKNQISRLRIPKIFSPIKENLSFSKISANILRKFNPTELQGDSLKSIHLLLRFLQKQGITRKIDVSVRTEYIFRHKIEVFVYTHPDKDLLYLFIFSRDTSWTLPVSIHLYIPERSFSLRVRTNILGHTSQVLRIENGELNNFIYTGINPILHTKARLYLKVNKDTIKTSDPVDIIYIRKENSAEIYAGHGNFKYNKKIFLKGLQDQPIVVKKGAHKISF